MSYSPKKFFARLLNSLKINSFVTCEQKEKSATGEHSQSRRAQNRSEIALRNLKRSFDAKTPRRVLSRERIATNQDIAIVNTNANSLDSAIANFVQRI
jgi:hypothetical protein